MKLTFLGTGTSFGIPVIGCDCDTCRSSDPRDRRTRHAALLQDGETTVLIDAPPELRLQLTNAGVHSLDAVWITHCHADHIHGLDDLRAVSAHRGRLLPIYAAPEHAEILRHRFAYIFSGYRTPPGTTKPELRICPFSPDEEITVGGLRMHPLRVQHGPIAAYGFRVGDLGYITDAKTLAPGTRERLVGVRTLVLNALWFGNPHPTHLNVEEALELARGLGAEHTYLTHLTHRLSHADLERALPDGAHAAYDGLVIDV